MNNEKDMNKPSIISVYKGFGPPFPTAIWVSIYLLPMDKSLGVQDHYSLLYDVISNKTHDWYFSEEDIARIAPKVVEALLKNPSLVEHCQKQYEEKIEQTLQLLDRNILPQKLPKMSDNEIADLMEQSAELYRMASYYVEPPASSLEVGGYEILKQKTKDHLAKENITVSTSEFLATFLNMTNPLLNFLSR